MIERNPISNDVRAAARLRRLGPDAHCLLCPYRNPVGLITVGGARARTLLEKHHVFGRNHNSGVQVYLCRNCHAETTEAYACSGIDLKRQPTPQASAMRALEAREVFLEILAEGIFQQDSVANWKGVSE